MRHVGGETEFDVLRGNAGCTQRNAQLFIRYPGSLVRLGRGALLTRCGLDRVVHHGLLRHQRERRGLLRVLSRCSVCLPVRASLILKATLASRSPSVLGTAETARRYVYSGMPVKELEKTKPANKPRDGKPVARFDLLQAEPDAADEFSEICPLGYRVLASLVLRPAVEIDVCIAILVALPPIRLHCVTPMIVCVHLFFHS